MNPMNPTEPRPHARVRKVESGMAPPVTVLAADHLAPGRLRARGQVVAKSLVTKA
jgi:hypothetical protein